MTQRPHEELLGAAEIAALIGRSRQRVQQIATRDDFPTPLAVLAMGSVWDGSEVREYLRGRGYQLTDEL
jgi:prophage regulatory protein